MSCCLWGEKPKVISWPHVCSKWVGAFGPLQPPRTQNNLFPCVRSQNHHVCSFFPQVEKCVCVWAHGQMCLSLLSGCVAEIKWEKSIRAARLLCVSLMLCVNLTLATAFFCVHICGRYERAQRLILTIFILPGCEIRAPRTQPQQQTRELISNVEMKSYYCIIIWSPAAVSF